MIAHTSVWRAAVCITVLIAGCAGLSGCGQSQGGSPDTATTSVATLDDQDQPLRDDFNRDRGNVRLMFLVDPICPGCLRGLADMDRDLLSQLPNSARVKVYVVHEPVLGATSKDIPGAASLLHTTLARHYWNPSGAFGRHVSNALGLRKGDRPVYAWDVWMIYPPDVVWTDAAPPHPQRLMHQLWDLTGNPNFPFLDSKAFTKEVRSLVAAMPPQGRLQ
jgi:hypothetical protein